MIMYLQKPTTLKENRLLNLCKIRANGLDIDTGKSSTQKEARIMLIMRNKLVPYRHLQKKRRNRDAVIGNLTMMDGITLKNITAKDLPPATYFLRKCEVRWMRACSQ